MELNPNHPVTKAMRSEWHKIAALLMLKFGADAVDITVKDIEAMTNCGTSNIVVKAKGTVLEVRLVDDVTALRLSEEAES